VDPINAGEHNNPSPGHRADAAQGAAPTGDMPRRSVYLSRLDAATLNPINETELEALLQGFETHFAAHLTLQQQINRSPVPNGSWPCMATA
jgi:hypothetical protein